MSKESQEVLNIQKYFLVKDIKVNNSDHVYQWNKYITDNQIDR